jgi:hypothetical protein
MAEVLSSISLHSSESEVKISGGGLSLIADKKSLKLNDKKPWKKADVNSLLTSKSGKNITLALISGEDSHDLLTTSDESTILRAIESMAALLKVRFDEHTGRSVEADEHGMTVIEQINTFPDRWPYPGQNDIKMADIARVGSITHISIPSELDRNQLMMFVLATLATLPIGLSMEFGFSSNLMNIAAAFLPTAGFIFLVGVLALKKDFLVSKHTIALNKTNLYVTPKFLGLIDLATKQYEISDFKDLDISNQRELTFLLGEKRISCSMADEMQAEMILTEIVDSLYHGEEANSIEEE